MIQSFGKTLLAKHLRKDWVLLLSLFVGISIATALGAGAPLYVNSLEQLAFNKALDRLPTSYLDLQVYGPRIPLTLEAFDRASSSLDEVIENSVSDVYLGHDSYYKGSTYLVGLPKQPLPGPNEQRNIVSRGYFQYLSNLDEHSRFIDGRMAETTIFTTPLGPVVEAVVGTPTAYDPSFNLRTGDVLTFIQDPGSTTVVFVTIVGIFEPDDIEDEYWFNTSVFLTPQPIGDEPPPGVTIVPDEPPVALFVRRNPMIAAFGDSFPGTMIKPISFIRLDKEKIKGKSTTEALHFLQNFQTVMGDLMPGTEVSVGGVFRMISDIKRRSFFSTVPLLLLFTVLVVTVLLFISMMVSFLVQSRQNDAMLWRTRGAGLWQVFRLYTFEGLAMTVAATVIAPFVALGTVSLSGKLPYFAEMTGGHVLPTQLEHAVFMGAAAIGVLCVAIFVIAGIPAAHGRLLTLKSGLSRPLSVPFFHRYFLDVVILGIGGLIFWELKSRGEIVSARLFGEIEVNEAMLLAPVLFLIMVALLFMRVFPLLVSYASGDSPALIHLLLVVTVGALGFGVVMRGLLDGNIFSWMGSMVALSCLVFAYCATCRAKHLWVRIGGLIFQAVLIMLFLIQESTMSSGVFFVLAIALVIVVPAQLLFWLLRSLAKIIPVWLSICMLHMARNPFQYSWLVLLFVLATGVAILSTTVGDTLRRSNVEQVLYDAPSDLRINALAGYQEGGINGLKDRIEEIPGLESASIGFRTSGVIGATNVEVLAVESDVFSEVVWFRDDFSDNTLDEVMSSLNFVEEMERIVIPDGTNILGIWARPESTYSSILLWVVVQDAAGVMHTLELGNLNNTDWQLFKSKIPLNLEKPLSLVSVQFFEPGLSEVGHISGAVFLDDIYAGFIDNTNTVILDGFEDENKWTVIPTSLVGSDAISLTTDEMYSGRMAALFDFGTDRNKSIRGLYHSSITAPVPVVLESSMLTANGIEVGDVLLATIVGRLIPVVVRGTVDYFPTMNPNKGGFVIADLKSLLGFVNIMGYPTRVHANEIFAKKNKDAGIEFEKKINEFQTLFLSVDHRSDQMKLTRLDPLGAASWRAAVLLSLVVVLVASALGYLSYVVSHTRKNRTEMGFLHSLGLSRRQLVSVLGLEHLIILVLGLALGTWAGFQMTGLMVSPLTVMETGEQVVPPFILTTNWHLMLSTYGAFLAFLLVALVAINRSIMNLDLVAIARIRD